jgi:hypothetical protein
MDPETATLVAQFGVAGLIGWMWLSERRTAQDREQKLSEAHDLLTRERRGVDVLLAALDANTRALATLEGTQRRLIDALDRHPRPDRDEPAAPSPRPERIAPAA